MFTILHVGSHLRIAIRSLRNSCGIFFRLLAQTARASIELLGISIACLGLLEGWVFLTTIGKEWLSVLNGLLRPLKGQKHGKFLSDISFLLELHLSERHGKG